MGDADKRLRRPDPQLRTDRVVLRPWTTDDVGVLLAAWTDPEVVRWTSVPQADDPAAFARRWIEQTPNLVELDRSLDLAVEHAGVVVGEVGLVLHSGASTIDAWVELGWWIGAEHRGRGLASDAVRTFADWVLAAAPVGLGFSVAYATCHDANPASGAVARRAGLEPCDRAAPAGTTVWERAAATT